MGIAQRLLFAIIVLFWGAMNLWLWRTEFGEGKQFQGSLPGALIWEKILTAPDPSNLEIFQRGKKVGYCRWTPAIGPEGAVDADPEAVPDGLAKNPAGYRLDLEGNIALEEPRLRLRLTLHVELDAQSAWRWVRAHLIVLKATWDIEAHADTQTLVVRFNDGNARWTRSFAFADLRHPTALMAELGGLELPPGWLDGLGLPAESATLVPPIVWRATTDRFQLGHSRLRVYRLRGEWMNRWRAEAIATHVGELLRIDLPGDVRFQNEVLQL